MSKGKILFQLSGSVACFKACALLSRLVQDGYEVEVVATKAALEFVGEATLEGLTGKPVHTSTFARGEYMGHINLMKWADLVILCPATANSLAKMASGVGDDLVSTLFLAYDFTKPYLIAPAMNVAMYNHPATREAIAKLENWGVTVLETGSGSLACGDVGEGRLLEPDVIYERIKAHLQHAPSRSSDFGRFAHSKPGAANSNANSSILRRESTSALNILITSGGTREPIDGVRSITNTSTGRTGAVIAQHLFEAGHKVTFVHAQGSTLPTSSLAASPQAHGKLKKLSFVSFSDLDPVLSAELATHHYDAVVHMAAVSDYSVESIETEEKILEPGEGKIDSQGALTLHLKRNPKLVNSLRDHSGNKAAAIVAFKLTHTPNSNERLNAIRKLANQAAPDFIVHNDLSEIDPSSDRHVSTIYSGRGAGAPKELMRLATKSDLARGLESLLLERHSARSRQGPETDSKTDSETNSERNLPR